MIFGSHPDLAVAHEPRFLATMAPKHADYEDGGRLDVDRFLADLYFVGNFRRLGIPKADLRASLETRGVTNFSDAVRVVFDLYARSRGKTLYGDKTPLYITFMEPIADVLPETRFVHLVRDGRDVTLAYLERDKGPASVAEGAFHWRLRVTRGRDSGRRLGDDRYREFHYEDLIDDPEATVRQICDFLDLDFQPSMLDYGGTSESFLAEAKNPGDHQHLTMAPTKGLIDWRTEMSEDDLALFEAIAGDALEELGYARAAQRPASRLVVWWEWARWQTRRVLWRVRWRLFGKATRGAPEG
jgi:Sulfotransferase family